MFDETELNLLIRAVEKALECLAENSECEWAEYHALLNLRNDLIKRSKSLCDV